MSPQMRCINRSVVALVAFVLGACLFPGTMIIESLEEDVIILVSNCLTIFTIAFLTVGQVFALNQP